MFVYSLGFYEMLHKSLSHAQNQSTIQTQLWKVFSILLEYCCQQNYTMLVKKIQNQHSSEIEKLEKDFNDAEERMFENERTLKMENDRL